jgi:hypothetical protein
MPLGLVYASGDQSVSNCQAQTLAPDTCSRPLGVTATPPIA